MLNSIIQIDQVAVPKASQRNVRSGQGLYQSVRLTSPLNPIRSSRSSHAFLSRGRMNATAKPSPRQTSGITNVQAHRERDLGGRTVAPGLTADLDRFFDRTAGWLTQHQPELIPRMSVVNCFVQLPRRAERTAVNRQDLVRVKWSASDGSCGHGNWKRRRRKLLRVPQNDEYVRQVAGLIRRGAHAKSKARTAY